MIRNCLTFRTSGRIHHRQEDNYLTGREELYSIDSDRLKYNYQDRKTISVTGVWIPRHVRE
jgi:hypothetical protein